nr:MAG TPA: hypothetical protein [Caudoviricetes sp.]
MDATSIGSSGSIKSSWFFLPPITHSILSALTIV